MEMYIWCMRNHFIILCLLLFSAHAKAQTDTASVEKPSPRIYTHYDSVRLSKLNSSGNLMIAGGVGLCLAGGYLLYQGNKVYTSPATPGSANPNEETTRNRNQGTIYYAAGGIAIAGGIVLTAFGARNKVDFKARKRKMEFQSGILDNGRLGIALNF
jgi:hypothetical protein